VPWPRFIAVSPDATIIEVPTDTDGLYWHVCNIDGASGDITVVNQIQNSAP